MARPLVWPLIADPRRWNRGFDQAEARSRRFQRHLGQVERSNVRFSASLGSMGGVAVKAFGGATVAAGGLAAAGTVLGLKTAANLETAEVGFTRLLGSAKEARSFLGNLKSFAARTPFELPGLVDASRALVGAGTAAKDVIPILTALGDASGALGLDQERFQRIMLATTQIMSKGKVQSEELLQITEAGIPVWQLLAKATGKPVPELQKLASQGKLLASDTLPKLFDQMRKDYGGGMEQQSRTLNGVWSTFKDTIALTLSDALQPLVPMLKTTLPQAGEAFRTGVQGVVDFVNTTVIPAFKTAQRWWDDNREAVRLLGEVLSTVFVPAADGATTSANNFATSGQKVKAVLDVLALGVAYLTLAWLRAEEEVNAVLSGFASLVIFAGHAVNALDRLSGGTGHAGDKMVAFGEDLKETARQELQGIKEDARKAQAAINKLHGKDVPITADVKVELAKSTRLYLQAANVPGFHAKGGPIRGPGTGTSDSVPAWLSTGEHVWTAREVTAAGGHGAMERWRKATLAGEAPRFAAGGAVGRDLGRWHGAVVTATGRIGDRFADQLATRLGSRLSKAIDKAVGGGSAAIKRFILSTDPLPYRWGAAGPGSFDCSGLVGAVYGLHSRRGGGRGQRYFTTATFPAGTGFRPGGGGLFQVGVRRPGPHGTGHMVGVYGGLPFEARSTATGIFVGAAARRPSQVGTVWHLARGGAVEALARLPGVDVAGDPDALNLVFGDVFRGWRGGKVFDNGGYLMPGTTVATNRTSRPERVQPTDRPMTVRLDPGDLRALGRVILDGMEQRGIGQVYLDGRRVERQLQTAALLNSRR